MLAAPAPLAADFQLATRITANLAETNRPNLKRLSVNVNGGHVTLRGSVASYHERQIAIQACRTLGGIEQLIDAVEVASGR